MPAKLNETPSESSDPPAGLSASGATPDHGPGAQPQPAPDRVADRVEDRVADRVADRVEDRVADRVEDRLLRVLAAHITPTGLAASPLSDQIWRAGSLVALLGFDDELSGLAGSLYSRLYPSEHDQIAAHRASSADRERAEMTATCGAALRDGGLCSLAVPIGPGGLLVTLARACVGTSAVAEAVGCAVVLPAPRTIGTSPPASVAAQLFHEAPGRVLVAIPAARYADATLLTRSHGVPLLPLGRTGGRELVIRASDGGGEFREVLRISVAALASPSTP